MKRKHTVPVGMRLHAAQLSRPGSDGGEDLGHLVVGEAAEGAAVEGPVEHGNFERFGVERPVGPGEGRGRGGQRGGERRAVVAERLRRRSATVSASPPSASSRVSSATVPS